jgi:hypothetical protein
VQASLLLISSGPEYKDFPSQQRTAVAHLELAFLQSSPQLPH